MRLSFAAAGACTYVATFAFPVAANASLVLLAVASVLAAAFDRRTSRRNNRLLAAVALFGLSTIVSTMMSIDVARSLRLSIPLIPGALLFLLISGHFDRRQIRCLYAALTLVSLAMAGYLLWLPGRDPSGGPVEWVEATDATLTLFVVPNDVVFFAAVLPLSLALVVDAPGSDLAILSALAVLADVIVVVVYQSRGALLTSLLVVGLWAVWLRRRAALALVGGTLVVILGTDGMVGFPLCRRFWETWATRIPIWLAALNMYQDAPLLGHGPRCFGVLFKDYFEGLDLPAWLPADPRLAPWAHNLYLETLAEQGIPGCAALLLVVCVALSTGVSLQRARPSETRTLGMGALTGLLALCAAGVFELTFLRLWVVVVFFSLLGAIAALGATADGPVAEASNDSRLLVNPRMHDPLASGECAVGHLSAGLPR